MFAQLACILSTTLLFVCQMREKMGQKQRLLYEVGAQMHEDVLEKRKSKKKVGFSSLGCPFSQILSMASISAAETERLQCHVNTQVGSEKQYKFWSDTQPVCGPERRTASLESGKELCTHVSLPAWLDLHVSGINKRQKHPKQKNK